MPEEPVEKLHVSITYGQLKAEFSGNPDEIAHSVNTFIANQLPAYNLARKLSLSYSAKELVEKFQDYIRITREGARISLTGKKVSDKQLVALQLIGEKIAFETGSSSQEYAKSPDLQEKTSLNAKSLSSRLSELSKAGCVVRQQTSEGSSFKISTQGISWLASTLLGS
jgi:hypothetical protein